MYHALMNQPIAYLERIRDYYLALGYETPYRWARFDDVPFCRPVKPPGEMTLAIITTAAPYQPGKGDQGPWAAYNGRAKFFSVYSMASETEPDLRISHVAIDRKHCSAEDQGTYFPLRALKFLQDNGEIGAVAGRFHGLPTNRSRRKTVEIDCAQIVSRCLEDQVDGAVLVANCPVCHQSVALAARALETAGIATVIMGCARDIVERVGVPRFVFSDLPLGNAAGLPGDFKSQIDNARIAVGLLASATTCRTTLKSPLVWPGAGDWKVDYSNAALLSEQELAARRREFDKAKSDAPGGS